MKKLLSILFISTFLLSIALVSAADMTSAPNQIQKQISYFYRDGCSHCKNVQDSGIFERVNQTAPVKKYDVLTDSNARNLFISYFDHFNVTSDARGTPLLVIQYTDGTYSFLLGENDFSFRGVNFHGIMDNLDKYILNSTGDFKPFNPIPEPVSKDKITFWAIIIAALIDSINPCAFGVLIFLMAALIMTRSSKRALRAGLLYSLIVGLTYFLVGLGIMTFLIQTPSFVKYILGFAAFFLLIGSLIEIKDFFWYGKGFSLKIPESVKPFIEKIIQKGTIPAIILLGVVVSLFELPCTGGIYLGILSIMAVDKTFGISYLLLYNIIFILPLVIITLLAYKGMKTERIQTWLDSNKKFMRLAAGIIMLALSIYLIKSIF